MRSVLPLQLGAQVRLAFATSLTSALAVSAWAVWPRGWAVPLLVLVGGALYVGRSVQLNMMRPLRSLASAAQAWADRQSGPPVRAASAYAEVRAVASAFNQMAHVAESGLADLTDRQNRQEAVLASMTDSVVAIASDGRLLLLNQAARAAFGLGEQTVIGRPLLEVIRHWALTETLFRTVHTGSAQKAEFQVFSPAERTFQAFTAPVRGQNGVFSGAVAVLRDVTELRRLERVRSDFVANVSHELRTPLTSIKGFLETLLEGASEDPELSRRFLQIAHDETERLAGLVGGLLDLTRLESDQTLQPHPVDLGAVVQRAVSLFEARAAAKGLQLETRVSDTLSPVAGDFDLLTQLLVNLLDNAVKYTPASGRVLVSVEPGDGVIDLSVTDTGPGIPEKHQPRVFERFYRVDAGRARDSGGSGLGLSIVKHIAERHGGSVRLQSTPGQGATFTVSLPVERPGRP